MGFLKRNLFQILVLTLLVLCLVLFCLITDVVYDILYYVIDIHWEITHP